MAFKDALTQRPREEAGPTTSMETSRSDDIRRAQGVGLDGTLSVEVKAYKQSIYLQAGNCLEKKAPLKSEILGPLISLRRIRPLNPASLGALGAL